MIELIKIIELIKNNTLKRGIFKVTWNFYVLINPKLCLAQETLIYVTVLVIVNLFLKLLSLSRDFA